MTRVVLPHSPEWFTLRCGSWSASRAPALMARKKNGEPMEAYNTLIGELAAERLTGQASSHFVTPAMERGLRLEPEAADAYALDRMVALGESQLVLHPRLKRVCATPDRFVGNDGLLEIKCPSVQLKHFDLLRRMNDPEQVAEAKLVREYEWQTHFQMMCTGRAWCDLASYFPEFPAHLQLAVVRIERNEERIAALEAAIEQAEQDVEAILEPLEAMTLGQREQLIMESESV